MSRDGCPNRADFKHPGRVDGLSRAWKQANLNYLQARNKLFANRGGDIEASIQAFARGQQAIIALLEDLAKGSTTIDKVAGVISEGVAIGTKLERRGA